MNRYINENIKPGEHNQSSSILPKTNKITLNEWIKTQSNTNAIQLIHHILTNDTRMNKEISFYYYYIFLYF
jgi:hypothetical protein